MCDKQCRVLALIFSACVGSSMELCATCISKAKNLYCSKHKIRQVAKWQDSAMYLLSRMGGVIWKLSLSHSVSLAEVVPLM